MFKAFMKIRDRNYKKNPDIKWNFTKFLVDKEGNVVRRFEPTEDLNELRKAVEELLIK
jgi:glutathione peroxidase